jgi:hypothetical protein
LGDGPTRCAEAKTTQMGDLSKIAWHVLSQKHAVVMGRRMVIRLVQGDRKKFDNAPNDVEFRQRVE